MERLVIAASYDRIAERWASSDLLRLARLRHPHVVFHQADVCEWLLPKAYQFITAWDSIRHVPLDQQRAVLQKLCIGLAANGVLIFTAGGLSAPDERRDEAMGVPMYHATLGVPQMLRVIEDAGCVLRHLEHDQPPEDHVFFIVQRT